MKICVSGSKGFLASYLIPKLEADGHMVTGIDYPDDIRTLTLTDKFDALVHLAAIAAPRICENDPSLTWDINVGGTYNIFNQARKAGVKRILFSSTAHRYGISPKYLPTNEIHPLALQDVYTVSKLLGEDLCRLFYENYNLSYVTVCLFNGYGPRQSKDYFIPATIEQAKKGHITLKGRKITKDFIYAEDIADAMVLALKSGYVGELNVGTGIQTSLEKVATMIADRYNVPIDFDETLDKGPTQMQCDLSRTRAILGWEPKIGLEEGLMRTMIGH